MVVPLARFQFAGILRPEERAIGVEHKEMRVAGNFWYFERESFIFVPFAVVDLHVNKSIVKEIGHVLVLLPEAVRGSGTSCLQRQQDSLTGPLCLNNRTVYVLRRVACLNRILRPRHTAREWNPLLERLEQNCPM